MCSHAREDFLKGSVTVVYLTIPMAEREAVEAKQGNTSTQVRCRAGMSLQCSLAQGELPKCLKSNQIMRSNCGLKFPVSFCHYEHVSK